jgi:hypothetical protein
LHQLILIIIYSELGTNGSEFAYGGGFRVGANGSVAGLHAGLQLYLPLITEEGVADLRVFGNYTNILRFNIYFNLGGLNFE